MSKILELAMSQGLELNIRSISYFVGRAHVTIGDERNMAHWRKKLFVIMSNLATDFSSFSSLPIEKVVEIGVELPL